MRQYTRVTLEVRCQIDAYLQVGFSIPEIAELLGFHKTSIYREIDRNFYFQSYCPIKANELAKERYRACRRTYKVKGFVLDFIIRGLKWGWSPDQISKRLFLERRIRISHECIYQFIFKYPILRPFLKRDKKRGAGRYIQRKTRLRKTSIRERPKSANNRTRLGHWERDTMYASNRKQLLICTDRKSRLTLISKIYGRTSKDIAQTTLTLLQRVPGKVRSITNDNGSEFNESPYPSKTYWCDPLRPDQRGTVENTIGLLRQWVKRNTDIDSLSNEDIVFLEDSINFRPRKCLGYRTPYEVFFKTKVALAY